MREPLEICAWLIALCAAVYAGLTFLTPTGWLIAMLVFAILSLLIVAVAALWQRLRDAFAIMQAFH